MATYIALLRGINVGGHKKILMADLRTLLEEMDLEKVQTYIQSGNIVFHSEDTDSLAIAKSIELKIWEKYGFDVPVLVKRPEDFTYVMERHPYPGKFHAEENRFMVVFLYDSPSPTLSAELGNQTNSIEQFIIDKNYIYMYYAEGYAKAKVNTNYIEKKLGLKSTARNLKKIRTLKEMAIRR